MSRTALFPLPFIPLVLALTGCGGAAPSAGTPATGAASAVQPVDAETWQALRDEGETARKNGDYARAGGLLQRALTAAEAQFGNDDPQLEALVDGLADAERELGHTEAAEALYRRVLAWREQRHGKDSIEAAMTLSDIGEIWATREPDRARSPLERAKAIFDAHPDAGEGWLALVLHNLASLHYMDDDYATARQFWERALAIRERLYGKESGPVATTLYNLAMLANAQDRNDEAVTLFGKALVAYEAAKGSDHPDVALCLIALADRDYCHDEACAPLAIRRLERALTIQRRAYGVHHPELRDVLGELAMRYEETKRFAAAVPLRASLLALAETQHGKESVPAGVAHRALARDYEASGKAAEARLHYAVADRLTPPVSNDEPDED